MGLRRICNLARLSLLILPHNICAAGVRMYIYTQVHTFISGTSTAAMGEALAQDQWPWFGLAWALPVMPMLRLFRRGRGLRLLYFGRMLAPEIAERLWEYAATSQDKKIFGKLQLPLSALSSIMYSGLFNM
ncbi:hypothetical protein F4819DRAFT_444234 [Hypoxylon fuscum]|nr:hypothetical protein F4819DRAFT_444234 [Hypoxylon fuscum]